MANRLWVTYDEVLKITKHPDLFEKNKLRVEMMISIAESKIISYCKNDFSNDIKYPELPTAVKSATLILADALVYNDNLRTESVIKSESYDDYSYTVDVNESTVALDELGLSSMLDPYVREDTGGNMKLGVAII